MQWPLVTAAKWLDGSQKCGPFFCAIIIKNNRNTYRKLCMSGPNNISNLAKTWKDITPLAKDFEGSVFPADDVRADEKLLADYKSRENNVISTEANRSKKLEITCAINLEREDWFGELDRFSDDTNIEYVAASAFPTSEIDDCFNHVDAVVGIKNRDTNYEAIPFGIDMTLDPSRLGIKMGWRHTWGKKDICPADESEFGRAIIKDGHPSLRRQPLQRKNGLYIPGFTSVKYFEDKNSGLSPMFEKGRITIMPHFVVGFGSGSHSDIIETLAWEGLPSDYPKDLRNIYMSRYNMAVKKAKWCTLLELKQQSSDIKHYLASMPPRQREMLDADELATATKQIELLDNYFKHAIEVADKRAAKDRTEQFAKRYAEKKDMMVDEICKNSHNVYIERVSLG